STRLISHFLLFFFLILPCHPRTTFFPYTTLFRSKLITNVRSSLMAVNIHITIIELNALHTKRQNLFQELDAVIHLLMEAKHWGLRKSRNATSLNSRFKSLDTLKVKKAASGGIQGDVLATDNNTVGMGDAGIKSAIQGSNVPNPDEAVPSFVSGAMAKAGKGLLEGTLQAGT